MSCRRASPNLHFATCLNVRPAKGCPCPKYSHSTTCLGDRHARSPQTVAAGKEDSHFTTPHVCPSTTRAISAEGCPRTNKTCISPHVWASDTPQKVTFRKPPPGCPCRQRAWKLVELLCGNSSVTISVQMTLQEFCRS